MSPTAASPEVPANGTPVVQARDLKQVYRIGRGLFRPAAQLQAVGGVSFSVQSGKTLAVVGESGCGKSTLARMVSLIEAPTAGELHLNGQSATDPRAAPDPSTQRATGFPEPVWFSQPAQTHWKHPAGAA